MSCGCKGRNIINNISMCIRSFVRYRLCYRLFVKQFRTIIMCHCNCSDNFFIINLMCGSVKHTNFINIFKWNVKVNNGREFFIL